MELSNRVNAMQLSPIRKFNPIAIEAEKKGKKVYHLNIGQPDVHTPECFMEAIRNYDKEVIAYAESGGIAELQEAIVDYFKNYNVELERKNILVTAGGSEALNMIFLTLLNDGDNVAIPEPFYTNYRTFAQAAGGNVVPITTKAEEGYNYADREKIEAALTPRTKAICCINPGNPTGTVLTLEEMKLICEIAKEHDLFVIADEVYREFVYDGREAVSFAQLDEYADRVIIVDSVSKRFSACGARIGCMVSKNEEFMGGVMKMAQGRLCVSTIDQIGSAAMFRLPSSYYDEAKKIYCERRDVVYEELKKIPGFDSPMPGGAFYITCKLPVDNVEDLLLFLLNEFEDNGETVMFTPAAGFYATEGLGKDEIRIAYVLKKEDMKRAVELLRLGIEAYNKKNK